MNINIQNQSKFLKKIPVRTIHILVQKILKDEKQNPHSLFTHFFMNTSVQKMEINIFFIDNKAMKRYNERFFRRRSATDVIAFSMLEGERVKFNPVLGDTLINCEIAYQRCKLYQNTFREEVLLLLIHSVLHILGYEHKDPQSIMRKREAVYFQMVKKRRYVL
ncbi:MAG: rRNA maturation RNase YbeY [bacterium]|nr:rRNA maturation RNase YbeY [bacterium]